MNAFIKWTSLGCRTANKEVGAAELSETIALPSFCSMLMFRLFLVEPTKIASPHGGTASNGDSSHCNIGLSRQILLDEMGIVERQIAVDKQQKGVMRLADQEIPDTRTPTIGLTFYIRYMV